MPANAAAPASAASKARHMVAGLRTFRNRVRNTLMANGGACTGSSFPKAYKELTGGRQCKQDLARLGLLGAGDKLMPTVAAATLDICEWVPDNGCGALALHWWAARPLCPDGDHCRRRDKCDYQHEMGTQGETKQSDDDTAAEASPGAASAESSPGAGSAESSPGAGSAESSRGGVAAARARATSAGELAAEASDSSDDDVGGAGYEDGEDDGRLQRLVRESGIDDGAVPADEGEPAPSVLESYRPFDLSDTAMEALAAQIEAELQAGSSGGAAGASHADAEVGRDGAHPARPATDADAAESRVAAAAADGTDAHGDCKTEHDPAAAPVPTEVELEAAPDRSHGEPTPALAAQIEAELQAGASGGADGASHADGEVGRDGARPSTDADAAESRVAAAAADETDAHGDRKTEHDPAAAPVPTEVELEAAPDRSHGEPTPAPQPPRLGVKALVALFEAQSRRHR